MLLSLGLCILIYYCRHIEPSQSIMYDLISMQNNRQHNGVARVARQGRGPLASPFNTRLSYEGPTEDSWSKTLGSRQREP